MIQGEIAQLRQRIADEYLAAQWGLSGLAYGTSRHQFITNHMERMQEDHEQLRGFLGDQAMLLIAQTLSDLPEQPTRYYLLGVLRHELGNTEDTAILIDSIQDVWETIDYLIEHLGKEVTEKIIATPERLSSYGEETEKGSERKEVSPVPYKSEL